MRHKVAKALVRPRRQRTQYTCMSCSMAMCLTANDLDTDEDEVNRVMGARPMKGAAWESALACAQHYGMRATLIVPATVRQLKTYTDRGIPVMIAWNPEGRPWSHASVVFDVDDNLNVHVADPNIPDPDEIVRILPKGEFYGKWYEQFPNYLVRRPAMAVEREVTLNGRQVVASANRSAAMNHQQAVRKLQQENPDVPRGDLHDAITTTSPRMDRATKRIQDRYYDLRGISRDPFPGEWDPFKDRRWAALDRSLGRLEDQAGFEHDMAELRRAAADMGPSDRFSELAQDAIDRRNAESADGRNQNRPPVVTTEDLAADLRRVRSTWTRRAGVAGGLYGFTKRTQSDCQAACRRLEKAASKIASAAYNKDARSAAFLKTHADRSDNMSARVLLAAMGNIGPKVATAEAVAQQIEKYGAARKHGLYGYPHKVANTGIKACQDLRAEAARVANDLHRRRAAKHEKITGFLASHSKEAGCQYSSMLGRYYPDAGMKLGSVPTTVGGWLDLEE